jgi:hypothetical protein
MRKIKEEVLKRLTNFNPDESNFCYGIELLQDFNALYPSPGAHEREEAKKIILDNSIFYSSNYSIINNEFEIDELNQKIDSLISYLEFHSYFYGVSACPSFLFFYEKNSRLYYSQKSTIKIPICDYKNFLQKHLPNFVIISAVYKEGGEWILRFTVTEEKSIFDNPSYLET